MKTSSETVGAICAVVVVLGLGFVVFNAVQTGEENQVLADKNCGPYKRVTWFHDDEGKIRSVCKNADDNCVVKP